MGGGDGAEAPRAASEIAWGLDLRGVVRSGRLSCAGRVGSCAVRTSVRWPCAPPFCHAGRAAPP